MSRRTPRPLPGSEAGGRKGLASVDQIKAILLNVANLTSEVGLKVNYHGFHDIKQLIQISKLIEKDEKSIAYAIETIRSASWKTDFRVKDTGWMHFPLSIAEEKVPRIRLRYFNPWYVKFILMNRIEKEIFDENPDQLKAREMMLHENWGRTRSILNFRGRKVEGLADIEILSYCDLNSLISSNSYIIAMPITSDKNLMSAIRARCIIRDTGAYFEGGKDDPRKSAQALAYSVGIGQKLTKKVNERMKQYSEEWLRFRVRLAERGGFPL